MWLVFAQVPDLFIIRLAAYQALLAHHTGSLTTRSLHSELIFNLSGSKHVRSNSYNIVLPR